MFSEYVRLWEIKYHHLKPLIATVWLFWLSFILTHYLRAITNCFLSPRWTNNMHMKRKQSNKKNKLPTKFLCMLINFPYSGFLLIWILALSLTHLLLLFIKIVYLVDKCTSLSLQHNQNRMLKKKKSRNLIRAQVIGSRK